MRSTTVFFLALCLSAASACKKDEPALQDSPPEPATEQVADGKAKAEGTRTDKPTADKPKVVAKAGKPPVVTLLEPGAEPRRELRYKVESGLKQTLETELRMHLKNTIQGRPAPATDMPPMLMTMAIAVTNVSGDSIDYGYEMTKADVAEVPGGNQMIADAIKKELVKVVGLKGKAKVDTRGMTIEASLDLPPSVPMRMKQLMKGVQQSVDQMSAPLPKEAVGKGAKWRVDQVIDQNGMIMTQTATFTLDKLTDTSAELSIELVQKAEPQSFRPPGLPTDAKLLGLNGKGKGTSKLQFDRLAPVESVVEIETKTSLEISLGGTTQAMDTETTMTMRLQGK